jgi:NADH-quinone oxidoreductase subunit C
MKTTEEFFAYLEKEMGEGLSYHEAEIGQSWILVPADQISGVAKFLRDDEQLRFNYLMCLSGVHYPKENELAVVYHLHSTMHGHTLVLKVRVPEEEPLVPSVEAIWKTANWHEREAYDLLGIHFEGHPNLRRILTPEDWEGHPLRKDYEQQDEYHGVSTGI